MQHNALCSAGVTLIYTLAPLPLPARQGLTGGRAATVFGTEPRSRQTLVPPP